MVKTMKMKTQSLNVLFSCIGRRVSLLNSFRLAAKQLKIKAVFFGTDATELSPALQLCDKHFIAKPIDHRNYLKELLQIVQVNKIDLIVPTIDLDLKILADNKNEFAKLGCCVLISSAEIVDICQDKRKTYRFLTKNNFDTPLTLSSQKALNKKGLKFPCFLKPWDGSASRGNAIVKNRKELTFFKNRIPNCIVQELIDGVEYTCDAFVDFDMKVRCVVPRKRIEIRAGEVSKSQTVKNLQIMEQAAEVVRQLGAGPGVITIQLILDPDGKIEFIEINPRFGGGVPLSIKAGANFPKWILQQLTGKRPRIEFDGFKDNLTMLRYDGEVWF